MKLAASRRPQLRTFLQVTQTKAQRMANHAAYEKSKYDK